MFSRQITSTSHFTENISEECRIFCGLKISIYLTVPRKRKREQEEQTPINPTVTFPRHASLTSRCSNQHFRAIVNGSFWHGVRPSERQGSGGAYMHTRCNAPLYDATLYACVCPRCVPRHLCAFRRRACYRSRMHAFACTCTCMYSVCFGVNACAHTVGRYSGFIASTAGSLP